MTAARQGNGMNITRAFGAALAASLLLIAVPNASAAPRVSIKVKRTINFGKSTKLTGAVAGVSPSSGVTVQLQEKLYPYKRAFETIRTQKTKSGGKFAFRADPDRNSRYRVRIADGSAVSGQKPVYVNGIGLTFVDARKPTIKVKMSFEFSPLLSTKPFSGLALRWYYKGKSTNKRFRRIKTTRTRRIRAGKIGGSMKFKAPKEKFTVAWCFRPHKHGDVGIGDPKKSFKACP
jgi:hypothetical protein